MKKTILIAMALAMALSVEIAKADFVFGEPTIVPNVNSPSFDICQTISSDGLTFYFASWRHGGYGNLDLWLSTRPTIEDEWGEPENLGPQINSSSDDYAPSISGDGLTLYFSDYYENYTPRPGGLGSCDIWKTTRATTEDDWGERVNPGVPINSGRDDLYPCISLDGLSIYFTSHRPGGYGNGDLWVSKRESTSDSWEESINLGSPVNTGRWDGKPAISADGCLLILTSNRSGGAGSWDLWMTRRATTQDDWTIPVPLSINTEYDDSNAALSADGRILYFFSSRPGGPGGGDIWQASIDPVVDLNEDGIVNAADMCIVVDHWGEYYPLCDIGPTPLGDGVVDVQDLIILAEHLFEDYRLISHWKLDEEEGDTAHDSTGVNDGTVHGEPLWLPASGRLDGALQFDGIDDFIETDFVLNPMDGAFSLFAWIKGGALGQVIISQLDGIGNGEAWLGLDAQGGNLLTGLVPPPLGRTKPEPLVSESIISDGQWYHIGFVWDGFYRSLYVDDVEVAKDTRALTQPLMSSTGGLYIGANKALDAGTFFSGLIDDVRIYNVALTDEQIAALAQ